MLILMQKILTPVMRTQDRRFYNGAPDDLKNYNRMHGKTKESKSQDF